MVEAVLRAAGPYSLRLTAGTSTWTARLAGGRWASAQQLQDGRVIVRASDELAVGEARFMLALDDDTSEFHRRFTRDPLLGPTVQRLRGMRTRRKATVTHAVIRAVAGQLIQASKALAIERAIIRGCGEDPPTREALAGLAQRVEELAAGVESATATLSSRNGFRSRVSRTGSRTHSSRTGSRRK